MDDHRIAASTCDVCQRPQGTATEYEHLGSPLSVTGACWRAAGTPEAIEDCDAHEAPGADDSCDYGDLGDLLRNAGWADASPGVYSTSRIPGRLFDFSAASEMQHRWDLAEHAPDGVTLRDRFARDAMRELLRAGAHLDPDPCDIAKFCYVIADAMIAARGKPAPK